MADATLSELADIVYVDEGDLRVLLASIVDGDLPDVVPEELCSELLDHLDPWPLVRRVPEYWEDDPEPPVNPLALPDSDA